VSTRSGDVGGVRIGLCRHERRAVKRRGLAGSGVRIHGRNDDGRRPERENAGVPPPASAELLRGEGVISRVLEGTACPALTFEIEGDVFKVSCDTRYDNGRCEDLEVGARVAWAGAKRAPETAVFVQRLKFAPLSR
jgi:hypothetical protein